MSLRWAVALSLAVLPAPLLAQAFTPDAVDQQIPGPTCAFVSAWNTPRARTCALSEIQAWKQSMADWRREERLRMGFDESAYQLPALRWTQSDFIQVQMMAHDLTFFDPAQGRYTVGRYVDDVTRRYGGVDSVLVWHSYPNLGVDDRNQYDLFRDLPGGLPALRAVVQDFHRRGIRVFVPFMIWDQGTRDEGKPGEQAIAEEMKAIDADGVNGDTLVGAPRSFFDTARKIGHPLAIEPQLGNASDEMLAYNLMSWGEEWKAPFVPTISRYKWLEPLHMVHLVHRWMHDRTDQLQSAFLNGIGYQAWENVWGQWNGITPRDAEALRRIHAIYAADAPYLTSEGWEPFADTQHFGVFASRWPGKDGTLWTLVNRNGYAADGAQLAIDDLPGAHFYDLWNAKELVPERKAGKLWLSFPIAAHGFGVVLATSAPLSPAQQALLHDGGAPALETLSATWHSLPQQMLPIAPAPAPKGATPPDMVAIPAADYLFAVHGIEVEGQNDDGADVQYPWESSARRYHQHLVSIPAFLIDRTPVTNSAFKRFLDATNYHPRDPHNFLRDWHDGRYPDGWADKPVTWVSREDAEAYAHWAGKRLPHEWEWQYAAQGTDGRAYPWGPDWDAARAPATDGGRTMQPASDVAAHPGGASPFGVLDMVGNVWQWTDAYADDHTRAAVLRGGSHYQPQASNWYFPQAYRLDEHGKYLLMAPSIDRSGAIGFRCVQDVAG